LAVKLPVDCVPDTAFGPDQPPVAVQAVAFVADQCSVALLPVVTVLGVAVKVTLGAGVFTATEADCDAVPPLPEHVRVNVEFVVNAPVDWLPLVALPPDQAPVAVQDVALVEDQVSVALPPLSMALGPTLSETVGADGAAATETVADCEARPPVPLQVSTKVDVAETLPVD
jgi:hypothetical protein